MLCVWLLVDECRGLVGPLPGSLARMMPGDIGAWLLLVEWMEGMGLWKWGGRLAAGINHKSPVCSPHTFS